jgi:nucleoside-diphosphate-sugar epimerase
VQAQSSRQVAGGTLLVTGVPGWLADAFLRSLGRDPISDVSRVRCLVQTSSSLDGLEPKNRWGIEAEVVRGDLQDTASLAQAVAGVDYVIHGAAIMHVRRIEEFYAINTQGTRNLAWAAAKAGVRRFVYLSTNAAAGRGDAPERLVRETDADNPLSHYGRSKWLGERSLFDAPGHMERTVLRPCMFYGPPVPRRHVDVYRRIAHGWMPLVGSGKYARSLTYIDNLLQGVRLALSKSSAASQIYNIADAEPYTTRQVTEAMARALEARPRYIPLPGIVATLAFRADGLLASLGFYQQTLHLLGEANWNVGVSIEKARRELGYTPKVGIEEGMRAAVRWCRERGLL